MDRSDEYRAYAAQCLSMARTITRMDDKREWLSLARHWLMLLRYRERGPPEAFEAQRRARVTGQ
jgi:hypothetical protein